MNTHKRNQESNQILFGPHPIWDEFHPNLLWRGVSWIPWGRERRTRTSNWRIQICIIGGPSRLLPLWKSQANFPPDNIPWHLSRWRPGGFQGQNEGKRDKRLAWRVSANGEHGGGKPTPKVTVEIWTDGANSPTPKKEDRVQIVTNDEFHFLDMKMSWSPEGELQFGVFRKKGQQPKYVGEESIHTPGTLCAIPSGVLNRLAKLTSRKPSI